MLTSMQSCVGSSPLLLPGTMVLYISVVDLALEQLGFESHVFEVT